ncbi:MAG: hypothetical protein E7524_05445 [Ruminococcaceae bacterium]|nr:hypothetical protein [Oscillospiraceae bacterium]
MKKHIVLKNQDADIYCFLNTIPKGERKEIVLRILSSALRGRVLTLPMDFVIKSFEGEHHMKIDISDKLMAKCEQRLGFTGGKFSVCLKKEIRRCINKNLAIPKIVRIPKSKVREKIKDTLDSINEKEKSLAEHPEKNKIMIKIILKSLDALAQDFRNYKKQGE